MIIVTSFLLQIRFQVQGQILVQAQYQSPQRPKGGIEGEQADQPGDCKALEHG